MSKNEITVSQSTELVINYNKLDFNDIDSIRNYGKDLLEEANNFRKNAIISTSSFEAIDTKVNYEEVVEKINSLSNYLEEKKPEKNKKEKGLIPLIGKGFAFIKENIFGIETLERSYADEFNSINESVDALEVAVNKKIHEIEQLVNIGTSIIDSDIKYANELNTLIALGEQDLENYKQSVEELKNKESINALDEIIISEAEEKVKQCEAKLFSLKTCLATLIHTIQENQIKRTANLDLETQFQAFGEIAITNTRGKADSLVTTKIQRDNINQLQNLKEMYNKQMVQESVVIVKNVEDINRLKKDGILEVDTLKKVTTNIQKAVDLLNKGDQAAEDMRRINTPIVEDLINQTTFLESNLQEQLNNQPKQKVK